MENSKGENELEKQKRAEECERMKEKPYDDNLYDLSLPDLLKYAGHESNVFIGQAKQLGNFAFIENLYSCNENQKGKLLIDHIFGYNLKAVVINQFENHITDGEYYKVKLLGLVDKKKRLERNQLFLFTAEIIDKEYNPYKKDVEDAFKPKSVIRQCMVV